MTATISHRTLVYDGWYKLWRVILRHDDSVEVERHIEDHGNAVAVLSYDAARRVALVVSLPRAPLIDAGAAPIWEAIAGNIDGADPVACARREAIEEAGVRLDVLQPVATVWPMPALSREQLTLFLAPYGEQDRIAPGGGSTEEAEHITVHEPALADLRVLLEQGAVQDAKLVILVQALMLRAPALFERRSGDDAPPMAAVR